MHRNQSQFRESALCSTLSHPLTLFPLVPYQEDHERSSAKTDMPVAPAFWPRVAPGTLSSSSLTFAPTPPAAPPSSLKTPPRGSHTHGLYGSTLVPTGSGMDLPWYLSRRRESQAVPTSTSSTIQGRQPGVSRHQNKAFRYATLAEDRKCSIFGCERNKVAGGVE